MSSVQLQLLSQKLGMTSDDYEQHLTDERKYLASLKKEPESTLKTVEYMDKLEKYWKAE